MLRRKKQIEQRGAGSSMGWMVTFADLMTLLFSFFLLLLSMSSLDRSILRETTSNFLADVGINLHGGSNIPARFRIIARIMDNPVEIMQNEQRIRDALFPDEVLPEGMARSTLDANVKVLLRPEGIALVVTDEMLFASGQTTLSEERKKLLSGFAELFGVVGAHVNIAGYTDNVPAQAKDNYVLSSERALAVLHYFLQYGFEPGRFSVSAYGDSFPVADNSTPDGRAKNRRVEILLKTGGRTYL